MQPKQSGSSARESSDSHAAEPREDRLLAALGSLGALLGKGVAITADRLQDVLEEAVRRGRMTAQDADELAKNLFEIGRRQTQDTLDGVRRAAGFGDALPIGGYDDLTAAQVERRLADLDDGELRAVREHERRNGNRTSVLTAIERRLG
ncbi:MAG: hypothetical protein Q8O56_14530 [Solirubrobacteraceae bacterium]|nr:hypothetical protein [Solirubrobacteraceae bacterium]